MSKDGIRLIPDINELKKAIPPIKPVGIILFILLDTIVMMGLTIKLSKMVPDALTIIVWMISIWKIYIWFKIFRFVTREEIEKAKE